MTLIITLKYMNKPYFFYLSKAKIVLQLYMNREKIKNTLVQHPNNLLILQIKIKILQFKSS